MTKLFADNEKEEWTDIAIAYDIEISNLLRPIFDRAQRQGHSLRDLQYIVSHAAFDVTLYRLTGFL